MAVKVAISASVASDNKWQQLGTVVLDHYGTREALETIRAEFIVGAIVPAVPAKTRQALMQDIPRKVAHADDEFGGARKEKEVARAYVHEMYKRVLQYAFPQDGTSKGPQESSKDACLKIVEKLTAILNLAQRETLRVDAVKGCALLSATIAHFAGSAATATGK